MFSATISQTHPGHSVYWCQPEQETASNWKDAHTDLSKVESLCPDSVHPIEGVPHQNEDEEGHHQVPQVAVHYTVWVGQGGVGDWGTVNICYSLHQVTINMLVIN